MLKVGITGGIGSGKTTVCNLFQHLGIPVYNADDRAKWLMCHQPSVKEKLIQKFGDGIYNNAGELQRQNLAAIVFNQPDKLEQLNQIVHPAVAIDVMEWMNAHEDHPYVVQEAALLIESGSYKFLDKLIVVTAPLELRISRVMKRDRTTEEEVKSRIKNQLSEEEKVAKADFIIYNDLEHMLIPQVYQLHQKLLQLSSEKKESTLK